MNDKLKDVSIEEMRKEIKKRLSSKPKLNKDIDWSLVIGFVSRDIVDRTVKDYEHYLFEIVMETMFGHDFWDWWNNKQNEAPQSDQ